MDKEKEEYPLRVKDLILTFIGILGESGWTYMGIIQDKITGKMVKDLDEAKLAIDTAELLFKKIKEDVDDNIRRDLERLIDDLKINYVMKLSEKGE